MFKTISTTFLLSVILFLSISSKLPAQAKYTEGQIYSREKYNKFNRMLGGDDSSFFCYRISTKGRVSTYIIEKYNKTTMQREFSKAVFTGEGEEETIVEDVEYAAGKVYIFQRTYDKKKDKATLFFQTVSATGVLDEVPKEIITINTDYYRYMDFEIFPNPSQTKFLVKAAHKANFDDTYKTDLIIFDALNNKTQSTRRIPEDLFIKGAYSPFAKTSEKGSSDLMGMFLTDKGDIFYCLNSPINTGKEKRERLKLYSLKANESGPKVLDLLFDDEYSVANIKFSVAENNYVVVGGFISDMVEQKGKAYVRRGIFSFKIDPTANSLIGKAVYFFEDKMLAALESSPDKSKYDLYNLDYILPVGDATYYVGELHRVTGIQYYYSGIPTNTNYKYEFMDVIVAKLNSKGEFEWIMNSPLRAEVTLNGLHVFKQYIAYTTNKNLYILCNDNPANFETYERRDYKPEDLKTLLFIHGSNFVSNAIDFKSGQVKREIVFKNEKFCFAPIQERLLQFAPPPDTDIFIHEKDAEIFIYTEDGKEEMFRKIQLE